MGLCENILENVTTLNQPAKDDLKDIPDTFQKIMREDSEFPQPRELLIRSTAVEDIINIRFEFPDFIYEGFHESGNAEKMTALRALQQNLADLERAFFDSGLEPDTKVGKWIHGTTNRVRIPVIDEQVDIRTALFVFSIGANILWLYLISCVVTIRTIAGGSTDEKAYDWLFFHSGFIGPVLGIAWILFPVAVLAFGCWKIGFAVGGSAAWFPVFTLLVMSGWIIWKALETRRLVCKTLGTKS